HESVPAKDLREFVALAKKDPGKMYYGSAGNGSAGHLAMEYLKQATGIDIQHVPYKGTGPNIIDLVAGRTQAASAGTPPLMPHVKAGKLRVIAVGAAKRLPTLPDVGTVAEQGYPGFETSQWYGLNAPAKTPEAIIKRLAAEAAKAAHSAAVKEILVLERAPEDDSGGNSRFTAGLMRVAYAGVDDLKKAIPDLSPEEIARTDFGTYTEDQFLDDMGRVTEYRCDPDLTEILVKQSLPTIEWMRQKGVRFTAAWGRQAFNIGGRFKFWGGLTVEAVGGGPGLVDSLTAIAKKNGIEVWFEARALELMMDDSGVKGVVVKQQGKTKSVQA